LEGETTIRLVRWLSKAVPLLLLAAAPRAEPAPEDVTVLEARSATSRPATANQHAMVLPGVERIEPAGERVRLDAPLLVRFDAPVPPGLREGMFEIDPAPSATPRFVDDRTIELRPDRWRSGTVYNVRIALGGQLIATGGFRTGVPEPKSIQPGEGARIVLTFDDGPQDKVQATRLLDLLKQLEIKALFFPSGRWLKKRPDFVERARVEGHRICNHTLSHINLTDSWIDERRIRFEIANGATDGDCRLFRPPLLGVDKRVERIAHELGFEIFLWDVDSRDWEGAPAEDIANRVLSLAHPNAIVLFHMHARATFEALPFIAARLREAGYVLSHDPGDARVVPGATHQNPSESPRPWPRPTPEAENPDSYEDSVAGMPRR
jgi:peptidoglycan/xylan/chitin deacetylase (PgdA/CDA1 family)